MSSEPTRAENKIAGCVRIVARPGGAEELLDVLIRMSQEAAKDDGTEIWAVHRARGGEEFFLYELFRDRAAFAVHQQNAALNALGRELSDTAASVDLVSGRLVAGLHPLM